MSTTEQSLSVPSWKGPSSRLLTTWKVLQSPFRSYRQWRRQYGDTMRIPALNGDVTVSCDLDFIKDFIKLTSEEHVPFGMDAAAPVFGSGSLLTLNGRRHARERKLLLPPFRGERMKSYLDIIHAVSRERISQWTGHITLTEEVMPISLDIIIQVVFGARDPQRVQCYHALIRQFIGAFKPAFIFSPAMQFSLLGISPWDRFQKAKHALIDQLKVEIQERKDQDLGEDILSLLLQATYEDGQAMETDDMADELVTLLIAGHETTQITIAWALYWLYRHPESLNDLRAEVSGVEDLETLLKLPFLDAVVNETMRIDPIVPDVLRTLTVDKDLGGHHYVKGSHIAVVTALLHTREDLYPNPEQFKPSRWLEQKPRPWTFFPFGGGARRCIGAALAIAEIKIVITEVVRSLQLNIKAEERSARVNVVMAPKQGVKAEVHQRPSA